jgi:DNA-binding transcriptional regulator YhcF (GntR family)
MVHPKGLLRAHVQLEERMKHLIRTGDLKIGSKLPSIRTLAEHAGVNRNTVARAVSELERAGYVRIRPGAGVYVAAPPAAANDRNFGEVLEQVVRLATSEGIPVSQLGCALLAWEGVPADAGQELDPSLKKTEGLRAGSGR